MRTYRWYGSIIGFVLGIIFLFPTGASAFSVSPLRYSTIINPGETATVAVQVLNNEENPITLMPEVDAFSLDSETGRPEFGKSDIAKSWVSSDNVPFTLEKGHGRIVKFHITVPKDALVVSHYLGLFVKEKPSAGQVGLGKRIGTLLFLHIAGPVVEKLDLQDFSVEPQQGKYFFHVQALNSGTIHAVPEGNIELFNWWGKKIGILNFQNNDRKVLPGEIWRIKKETSSPSVSGVGPVSATLELSYGLSHQKIQSTIVFWYLPWWSFMGVGILCGFVFLAIFLKRKKV